MNMPLAHVARRRSTNVSLNEDLLAEARALGINLSRACELGLAQEVTAARSRAWRDANVEAIASANAYVEREGLPLAASRLF